MEKETSISEIIDQFLEFSGLVEKEYGVLIQLASISGNRWSYLAGHKIEDIFPSPPERIQLNEALGLIIYNNARLSPLERKEIVSHIRTFQKR